MTIALTIEGGQAGGRSVSVQAGQAIRVGRSEQVDFVVPHDHRMSRSHFAVEYENEQVFIRDLGSTGGTFVNGAKTDNAELHPGDRITAGETSFSVRFTEQSTDVLAEPGQPAAGAAAVAVGTATGEPGGTITQPPAPKATGDGTAAIESSNSDTDSAERPSLSAAEIAKSAGLNGESLALGNENSTVLEFLTGLANAERLTDALNFAAFALPTSAAVSWACGCVRSAGGDASRADADALAAAETWAEDPTETNRRAAMQAAERLNFETPACWCALAAFWSGGSLAPPEAPSVPPQPDMSPKALSGALAMASVLAEPERAHEKQRMFVEMAKAALAEDN